MPSSYRAGAGSGLFGSYAYGNTRPQINVGSAIDAFANGASSLIHAAYQRKRQEAVDQQQRDQVAYQRQRDQIADSRYEQGRQDRLSQEDRQFQLGQLRIDAANARAGYVPPTTKFDATPVSTDFSSEFSPNLPTSLQTKGPGAPIPMAGGVGTDRSPIARAMSAGVSSSVSPSQQPTASPAPPPSRLITVPGHFDPNATPAAVRTQQAIKARAEAYEGAGLSTEEAAAAAVNPSLATKLLAPHGKKVYFNADGAPVVVDVQDPQFPSGFKKPGPVGRPSAARDPNISASIATQRAITETNRQRAATVKAIPKPAAFSMNPQADSAAVVGASTPLLAKAGDLAVRADSLRRAYDQQASAIGTGRAVHAGVDVSAQRQELDRRQQQMAAIVANPKAPLTAKARAQELFRQYIESIGSRQ
jgi:hypothetical protein